MSLIGTAKHNGLDPEAYLRSVLAQIAHYPAKKLADLLPWGDCVQGKDRLTGRLPCTNIIENMNGTIRQVCRNVKRWRDTKMALR